MKSVPMASRDDPGSDQLVNLLRGNILRCVLKPGSRLVLDELKARFGFGASPLREALMQLVADGLVVFEANRGFRVASLSKGHFDDVARVRTALDVTAVTWALKHGSIEWEVKLVGAFHRLASLRKSSDTTMEGEWSAAHRSFHSALVSGCESPTLLQLTASVFDHIERYIALSVTLEGTIRDGMMEHEAIMKAALDRDLTKTLDLLHAHNRRTEDTVNAYLLENGGE